MLKREVKPEPAPVFKDSPEAATYRTDIRGWVCAKGYFFGEDEATARSSGATHAKCERCGAVFKFNHYGECDDCRDAEAARIFAEKFAAMPSMPYDPKTDGMVFSYRLDDYFDSPDEAMERAKDEAADQGLPAPTMASLQLVFCVPNRARKLSEDDFSDDLPEGVDDLPSELIEAIESFNAKVKDMAPLSWSPGKIAVLC